MSGGARFDAHQARRKFRKEAGYLCSLQLASNDNLPRCINPMHLEDAFAKVETYCQRRWKTRPHASVRTGQFRAVFSDGRDWVSALARALPI